MTSVYRLKVFRNFSRICVVELTLASTLFTSSVSSERSHQVLPSHSESTHLRSSSPSSSSTRTARASWSASRPDVRSRPRPSLHRHYTTLHDAMMAMGLWIGSIPIVRRSLTDRYDLGWRWAATWCSKVCMLDFDIRFDYRTTKTMSINQWPFHILRAKARLVFL